MKRRRLATLLLWHDVDVRILRHDESIIGEVFWCGGSRWRCTDIGTRVIAAIKLDHEDGPSWYNGPPYAVPEFVFDEYDVGACPPLERSD